jgi:hypothetical protein
VGLQIRRIAYALDSIFDKESHMVFQLDRPVAGLCCRSQQRQDGVFLVHSLSDRVLLRAASFANDPTVLIQDAAVAPRLMIEQRVADSFRELEHGEE